MIHGGISLTRKVPVELHEATGGYQGTLFDSKGIRGDRREVEQNKSKVVKIAPSHVCIQGL